MDSIFSHLVPIIAVLYFLWRFVGRRLFIQAKIRNNGMDSLHFEPF